MSELITDELSSYILDQLETQGIAVEKEARVDRPNMPEDITQLQDEDLMVLYTQFIAYSDFLNTQLACAIIDEKDIERQISISEAENMISQGANTKLTVTAMKASMEVNPEVRDIKIRHIQKYAYRKLLETIANNTERHSAVCSRELTRRTAGDNFKTRSRKFVI
jgi:hypothetical protein